MSKTSSRKEKVAERSDLLPRLDDVLLGRNINAFQHPGNQRYRYIIALNLRQFEGCKDWPERKNLVKQVIEDILDNGRVRFLTCEMGKWIKVPLQTVRKKVSHALRDGYKKTNLPTMSPLEEGQQQSPLLPKQDLPAQISIRMSVQAPALVPQYATTLQSGAIFNAVSTRERVEMEQLQKQFNDAFLLQQRNLLIMKSMNFSNPSYSDVSSRATSFRAPAKVRLPPPIITNPTVQVPTNVAVPVRRRKKILDVSSDNLFQVEAFNKKQSAKGDMRSSPPTQVEPSAKRLPHASLSPSEMSAPARRKKVIGLSAIDLLQDKTSSKERAERKLVQIALKEYTERQDRSSRPANQETPNEETSSDNVDSSKVIPNID